MTIPPVTPAPSAVAAHVLRWLAIQQARPSGDTCLRLHGPSLDDVVTGVGARRAEVRAVLSSLHREGCYDVLRGRLTLVGFALGRSLAGCALMPLRSDRAASSRSAAA